MVILWFLLTVVGGCASYSDHLGEIRQLVSSNRYRLALQKLETSPLKKQTRNRLLYQLEKAMLLDRLGNLAKSREAKHTQPVSYTHLTLPTKA